MVRGVGVPTAPAENGRGGSVSPPLPKTGVEEGLRFCRHSLCQNIQYGAASSGQHAKHTTAGPLAAARAPAPHAGGAGP